MKKPFVIFFVIFLIFSCNQKIEKDDIAYLNGYWEIEKVILSDGEKKEYKISETIDYFKIDAGLGFRKKVLPQLDGTYIVNDQKENIKIITIQNEFFVEYSTDYAKWKEKIVAVSNEKLVLKNEQNLEYHYKKPIPFSIK